MSISPNFIKTFSLDEARVELYKRGKDSKLKTEIESELGEHLWPEFKRPRGLVWKSIISPDNSIAFFYYCCRYINIEPLGFEFLDDIYLSINEEKRGLGQLHVTTEEGIPATINLFDLHKWNKQQFSKIAMKNSEPLVDFHHQMLEFSDYNLEVSDKSEWAKSKGKPVVWYYYFLLHFLVHGVLFESFISEEEDDFFKNVVLVNLERINAKFGLQPIIVNPFPDPNTQTENEDFFWWSYPKHLNEYIIDYANKNDLYINKI